MNDVAYALLDKYEGKAIIEQNGAQIPAVITYLVTRDLIDISVHPGETVTTNGLLHWSGSFEAQGRIRFADATLVLPDGRTGSIVITGLEAVEVTALGNSERHLVASGIGKFEGNGPAPARLTPSEPG